MQHSQRGDSPEGWRHQLLARLRNRAREEGVAAQRLQQRVAFERLLARLPGGGDWVLKGGLALELRYGWAQRPTKDIDLRVDQDVSKALDALRRILAEDASDDRFSFDLGEGMRELGVPATLRIPVRAMVAGVTLAQFHVDLSTGDPLVGEPDIISGSDLLAFAGLAQIRFPIYTVTQTLAEKLHAYTFPRARGNTRVKDLVDLVVIAGLEHVDGALLVAAVNATFDSRGTHPIPPNLPPPPADWATSFSRLAREAPNAPTTQLQAAYRSAQSFWDPMLAGQVARLVWMPAGGRWGHPE